MKRNYFNKVLFLFVVFVFVAFQGMSQYPGETWDFADNPEEYGFDSEKLQEAREHTDTTHTAAVVIVNDGVIVDEWGDVEEKYMTHSVRKSFLSALYGDYVKDGTINLEKTMGELGIKDKDTLTEQEKRLLSVTS